MSQGRENEKQGQYPQQQPYQPQHQAYPAGPAYPTQTGQYPQYAMPPQPAGAGYPQEPPPPYTPPQQQGYAQPQMGMYQQPAYQQQAYQQQAYQQPYNPTNTTVVAPNSFDAGARFGTGSSVNIPPPPPGIAPNQAQAAQQQGYNVQMGQRRGDWLSGGSDGGYVWW